MEFKDLPLSEQLLIACRGTTVFADRLADLAAENFNGDTLLDGWTRKHLIAHVGYNAAALCRLMSWAATGTETPMYASAEQRQREIAAGATQSPAALCTLFCDSAEQLDVKWRNLPESAWAMPVRTAQGRTVAASEAVWMRTREVWIHAVDLDNGTQFTDMPEVVQTTLLGDIVGLWQAKNLGSDLVIEVTGTKPLVVDSSSIGFRIVQGTLAAVVRWAAGRGAIGVACDGPIPLPPHWL